MKAWSDLSVPTQSGWNWHLTLVYETQTMAVVKASSGHYPLPFLISDLKNCNKDRDVDFDFPNYLQKIFYCDEWVLVAVVGVFTNQLDVVGENTNNCANEKRLFKKTTSSLL